MKIIAYTMSVISNIVQPYSNVHIACMHMFKGHTNTSQCLSLITFNADVNTFSNICSVWFPAAVPCQFSPGDK